MAKGTDIGYKTDSQFEKATTYPATVKPSKPSIMQQIRQKLAKHKALMVKK